VVKGNSAEGTAEFEQNGSRYVSIPAMSAEPERLFSGPNMSITDQRNRLVIESWVYWSSLMFDVFPGSV
jgi:hypothetical protein